jgi:hypothetical protein
MASDQQVERIDWMELDWIALTAMADDIPSLPDNDVYVLLLMANPISPLLM